MVRLWILYKSAPLDSSGTLKKKGVRYVECIRLYLADIRQLKPYESAALPLLTPERRERAEKTKVEQDRLHCIAAGLLLRRVLGIVSDAQLRKNEQGRPEPAGEGPCFNLSHGGSYAVLAVAERPVGVDIEPVSDRVPIIPRRFLQPDELVWLEAEPTPERFAWLWTRLESALKADGRGFELKQRDFSVLDGAGLWKIETAEHEGHILSCAAENPFELQLCILSAEELLHEKS